MVSHPQNLTPMIRNYLLVAWRSLKKNKTYTLINLVGLSLSMSVCLLLILLVVDQTSYDEFHPKKDQIYRILTQSNDGPAIFAGRASTTARFKTELEGNYTYIKEITALNRDFRGELRSEYKILDGKGLFADEVFLSIFDFELSSGDAATALSNPYSIVLTKDLAAKLFPGVDPMGKLVEFADHGSYQVTGIIAPLKGKTHIQFEMLGSYSTLPGLENKSLIDQDFDAWENIWMSHIYLVIPNKADIPALEQELNRLAQANIKLEDDHAGYTFILQSLNDVTPGRILGNELGFTLPIYIVGFFLFLGLIVILTASINYTNLSVAKSLSRAREIGIRKVNGAMKSQIISQFLVESILLAILSLGISIVLYRFLLAEFNSLWVFSIIQLRLDETPIAYLFFFAFSLGLGVITGIGPALYLSKFNIVTTLKGNLNLKPKSKRSWYSFSSKKLLLGIQFSLATFLIITIFIIKDQAHHLTSADYGFNENQVFYLEVQGHDTEQLRTEFERYHGTVSTSFASHHPAVGISYGADIRLKMEDEPIVANFFWVDKNYPTLMKIPLIAGELFPESLTGENETMVLVNEQAARMLGYTQTNEIIGNSIIIDDSLWVSVIGLVADYHFEPMMKSIEPLMLRYKPADFSMMYLKLATTNPAQSKKDLMAIWNKYDPKREFKGGFLNEELTMVYQFFYDISKILTVVALLAIVITCLGLLGMVSFSMKTRVKEIGIRKVLGAEQSQLLWLLSKEYGAVLLTSLLIGGPLAIVVNGLWVNLMAQRAGITFMNTAPGILIVIGLSLAAVLSQTWKTAQSNPVESLRSE